MSAVRYWPLAIVVLLAALFVGIALAAWALTRWRAGAPFGPGGMVIASLAVLATISVSLWAVRPGFLAAPGPPRELTAATHQECLATAESYLESLVAAQSPPGLTALVVKDGEVVYSRGFGLADGPGHVPASPDTVYRWWSITKLFTAVAVMQLQEQGLLDIDDPVARHLPDFSVTPPDAADRPVTIRDLLTHSSGLPDAGNEILGWLHFEGDPALDQTRLLREVLPRYSTLGSAPGTEGHYTNIGYMVLASLIQEVSGERYEDYVTAHILKPLGMTHTGFEFPDVPADQVAVGSHPLDFMAVPASFAVDLDLAVRERSDARLWFERVYPDQTGPSGLIGTAPDMARFMAAMLDGGEFEDARILSEASVDAMAVRHLNVLSSPAPGTGFGFGLAWFHKEVDGRVSLSHGGQGMGMTSLMSLYPDEGLGVVVVGNSTYLGRDFGATAVQALACTSWEADAAAAD